MGTSGWLYDWNPESSFDWYVAHSGLNAVELNASFYRFPFRNQVLSWARKGGGLRWAVKVNRYVTHIKRLKPEAFNTWVRFHELFKPLDPHIDFYLFQLPPSMARSEESLARVRDFAVRTGLGPRFAVEFRHESWFNKETLSMLRDLGITVVSVDEPGLTWVASTNGIVYLRLHGRNEWYAHNYTREELRELVNEVLRLRPSRVYVFFNNNHWMLDNARLMLRMLRGEE